MFTYELYFRNTGAIHPLHSASRERDRGYHALLRYRLIHVEGNTTDRYEWGRALRNGKFGVT